ncbi:MAG: hypothetical protein JST92_02215, partial [Deltaproteobacteria bacterium]|nr:hypothetical protein [Deltaproteobacteria bacterium]
MIGPQGRWCPSHILRGSRWRCDLSGVQIRTVTRIVTNEATHRAIHAVFRIEQAKLIAQLTRLTRDVGLAEELAQDALVAALETWPAQGVPDRPAAWLLATAKRKGVDRLRKERLVDAKQEAVT